MKKLKIRYFDECVIARHVAAASEAENADFHSVNLNFDGAFPVL
ncbi:MAG: hypothetical protein ACFCUN_01730 [Hyphomicrobiaceae bacterium]